jgi:hypothetical protein
MKWKGYGRKRSGLILGNISAFSRRNCEKLREFLGKKIGPVGI